MSGQISHGQGRECACDPIEGRVSKAFSFVCASAPRPRGSLLGFLAALMHQAAAADMIGDCELTGQKGVFSLTPAVPGQLTVEVALPAPGWWNGDTPATIKDGYEYCMAADIAHRAGLDKVEVVNVSWSKLIAGQTKNFDLSLSEASITPERKKVIDFSIPYFNSDIGVLVKATTKVNAENIQACASASSGDDGRRFRRQRDQADPSHQGLPERAGMFTALAAGQIDTALSDTAYLLGKAAKSNGTMMVGRPYSTGEIYCAIYPKGSPTRRRSTRSSSPWR